jgi:hypothetical protein
MFEVASDLLGNYFRSTAHWPAAFTMLRTKEADPFTTIDARFRFEYSGEERLATGFGRPQF